MTKAEAWFSHAATLLVGGTGLVYGWMRYIAEPTDEFAVVNHPWEPTALHLHILLAPLMVFATGLVWRTHVWKRLVSGFLPRRRTGLVLFAAFVPMGVSGYLIQTTTSELWREVALVVHVATSCLWILGYVLHQLTRAGQTSTTRG